MFKALKWAYGLGRKQAEHEYRYAFEKQLKSRGEILQIRLDLDEVTKDWQRNNLTRQLELDDALRHMVNDIFYPQEQIQYTEPRDRFDPEL